MSASPTSATSVLSLSSLVIETSDDPEASEGTPLAHAWIYWKSDGEVTTVRTDEDGLCWALSEGGDAWNPEAYAEPFLIEDSGQIKVFYSTDGPPYEPDGILAAHPEAFFERDLDTATADRNFIGQNVRRQRRRPARTAPGAAPTAPTSPPPTPPTNTLVAAPTIIVVAPNINVVSPRRRRSLSGPCSSNRSPNPTLPRALLRAPRSTRAGT